MLLAGDGGDESVGEGEGAAFLGPDEFHLPARRALPRSPHPAQRNERLT